MLQPYFFTYIIGYRHRADKLNSLKGVLEWINGFQGSEVIIVEQDKHSKISHLNLKAKHVFLKTNMPYNRSWAFNVGLKRALSNIIVFADADIIMHPNNFIEGLKQLQQFEMVSPNNSIIDLDMRESSYQVQDILNLKKEGRIKNSICDNICMYRKDAISRIGGFDESFIGLGKESEFNSIKTKQFLNWTELNSDAYHLYHDNVETEEKLQKRNDLVFKQLSILSKNDIEKYINKSIQKIGLMNKYNTF